MDNFERNFGLICRKFNQFLSRELQDVELSPSELSYLHCLLEKDGLTQGELAKMACVDKAAVTRAVQRMEKKGMIERKQDETDRRATRLYLTEKAFYYKNILESSREKWVKILNVQMTEEQMQFFEEQVAQIAENVKKAIP